jgi:hypothetical protein
MKKVRWTVFDPAQTLRGCGSLYTVVHSHAEARRPVQALCLPPLPPNPLAERRKPDPQIKRNLTPFQASGERDAIRIPLKSLAVYRGHIRSPCGRVSLSNEQNETSAGPDDAVSLNGLALRRGALVQNLTHSASLHSRDNIAPSKPGIKQLELANTRV